MKYTKLILLLSIAIILTGLLLTACDNRIVDPLNYTIADMTVNPNVIYSDSDETTFSTIKVMIKDDENYAVFGQIVHFRSDMGFLQPAEAATDSSGIATVKFHDNGAFGAATIDAIIGSVSETRQV
jgi:hypothetical protein